MKKNRRWFSVHSPLMLLAVVLFGGLATSHAATAKPTLAYTNLKAGQNLSSGTFTVEGKATSSAGISNVLYSLNHGGWTAADPGNNWTNWSAVLTLTPGTNILSTYAVDNGGVHSQTNTVKFVYVVTAVLTVGINGPGTIKPNYNGAQLQLGKNYSMKAKPASRNYLFRNWTDGSNNVVSGSAKLTFLMTSNLALFANFNLASRPTVDVSSTVTNKNGIPNNFVIIGTTKDTVAMTNVFYRLNGGSWQTATTSNNWATWSANVTLLPGANNFYAYAVDVYSNSSPVLTAQISYNSEPLSLSGQSAVVTDTNNQTVFTVAFGKTTFSQLSQDTNYLNAVGTYTFTPADGGGGTLKIKYTAPPSAVNKDALAFGMLFFTPSYAYVSITNKTMTNSGYMQLSSAPNFAIANISGQLVWSIGSEGGGTGTLFQNGQFTSQSLLSADTNSGSYTYTQESPVSSLFKLTSTGGTSYLIASFADTNYGSYYEEDYDSSNVVSGTDTGRFLIATQKPGGNAPLTLTNRNLQVFSVDGTFNEQFGVDTYSQDTLSTNYDNAVGDYTYDRPDTNIGQLNLAVTQPPTLVGTDSAARLIFVGDNVGLFTNTDGTLSSFVMTAATNYTPASITNLSLPIGFYANIHFTNDGSFVYTVYNNPFFPSSYSGNYTYTNFSPGTAMVQLDYLNSNTVVGIDWLQLNFKSTIGGNIVWKQFNTNSVYTDDYYSGTFSIH